VHRIIHATAAALGCLTASALLCVGCSTGDTPPTPAPTVTVTVTAPPTTPTTDTPTYTPAKTDWAVTVKVKERQCFGEAGCNTTVAVDPQYVGTDPLPTTGTIEVTYEISGDTSGPVVGTFTVEDSQIAYDKETDLDTRSAHTRIVATVTDATYTP